MVNSILMWCVQITAAAVLWAARLLLGVALAAQSGPGVRFDNLVRADFFAGLVGDQARFEKAMRTCERVLAEDPKQAEALVWHGAGLYFQAGQAFRAGDVERGGPLAGRGLREMDDAVALDPDNVGVVIPRGAALLESARQMDPARARPLLEKAVADYEHVLAIQQPIFDTLGDHAKGELLFGLADGWARLGDLAKARAYFTRLVQAAPQSTRATEARDRLQNGGAATGPTGRCGGCHG